MGRVRFTPEQIIGKLREAELLLGQGTDMGEAVRKLGISQQTYYCWRKEYGGMRVDQARRLKELETENSRLKKLVADLYLDNAILKESLRGNFLARRREAGRFIMPVNNWEYRSGGPARCWIRPVRPSGIRSKSRTMRRGWWNAS